MTYESAKALLEQKGQMQLLKYYDELDENYVIPSPFDKRVAQAVAKAVADMAIKEGVIR